MICAMRRLSLIVNPVAGGGRPARALPDVQSALRAQGLEYRFEYTKSLEHARELAVEAVGNGEVAVAFGGDGLIGAVAGAVKDTDGVVGILPGGRGNDLCRVLGIPRRPVAACAVLASGVERRLDLGQAGEKTFAGIASCGFDSEVNRIANETRVVRGSLVYAYGTGARAPELEAGPLQGPARRRRGTRVHRLLGRRREREGVRRRDAARAGRLADDGQLDVVMIADMPKHRFLRLAADGLQGPHVASPTSR